MNKFFKQHLQPINDVYFISDRIKEINPNYKLFYNTYFNRFEVHDTSLQSGTLCNTFNAYPSAMYLEKLIKTRRENMAKLFQEIELANAKLDQERDEKFLDIASQQFKEISSYSSQKVGQNLTPSQIKKIIN